MKVKYDFPEVVRINECKQEPEIKFSSESGILLKITSDGRIIFGDFVKNNNVEDLAQEFIRIVEESIIKT
jgi:hypothetical protein